MKSAPPYLNDNQKTGVAIELVNWLIEDLCKKYLTKSNEEFVIKTDEENTLGYGEDKNNFSMNNDINTGEKIILSA